MVRLNKAIILSLIGAALIIGSTLVGLWRFPSLPLHFDSQNITYILTPGTSVKGMLRQLRQQGILQAWQAPLFYAFIYYHGAERQLKAGEYAFPLNITPEQLLHKLLKGDVVQHAITFAEGVTFHQALALLWHHPAIKKTLQDTSPVKIMELLGEPGLCAEGLFFPATYYFTRNTSDFDVLQRARQAMQQRLWTAWEARDQDIILKTPYEALILASIIEKESALAQERPLISGVFHRRLANHMRLQADPTVIYGVREYFQGDITREMLKQDTPYNTYLHKGLPPTPIALPGLASIVAALHPDKGNALYFVAKGDGSHYFSAQLSEHNQAVNTYQLPAGTQSHE